MEHNDPSASRHVPAPAGHQSRAAREISQGSDRPCVDTVAEEIPVAMVYNGISHAVMLATPLHLEDFALGFGLAEGILHAPDDLHDFEAVHTDPGLGIELRMTIAAERFALLSRRRRNLAGRTGCGLCGLESLQALADEAVAPKPSTGRLGWQALAPRAIESALRALPVQQSLFELTGGVHAAAWASRQGQILVVREDVGRHNALDKLLGAIARLRIDANDGFVICTSRASYEMAQKAARCGISLLVAVSSPTSRAIDLALRSDLTLCGFARDARMVVYSHPWRVATPEPSLAQ